MLKANQKRVKTACSCSMVLPPPCPWLCGCGQLAAAVPHATGLIAAVIPDNYPYHHHPHHLSGRKKINTKDMHFGSQTTHKENRSLSLTHTLQRTAHTNSIGIIKHWTESQKLDLIPLPIVNWREFKILFFFFHRESSHLKIGTVLDSLSWGEEPTSLGQDLSHCYTKLLLVSGWAVNWDLECCKVRKDFGEFLAQSLGFSHEAAESWRIKWLNPRLTIVAGSGLRPGLCPWPGTTPQPLWHDPSGKPLRS